jgi:Hydantoinase/oxoprolinase N-terminal region
MRMIGIDVGGTFTDLVYVDSDSGVIAIRKVPTTPDDPSIGMMDGIAALCAINGVELAAIDVVLHASTIATNAVLEYDGSTVGMLTTEGFRDVLHIGRHQRPHHYSLRQEIPWQVRPLVRRAAPQDGSRNDSPPIAPPCWSHLMKRQCGRPPANSVPKGCRPSRSASMYDRKSVRFGHSSSRPGESASVALTLNQRLAE